MNIIKNLKINIILYIIFHSGIISDSEEMCVNLIQNYEYTPKDLANAMEKYQCKSEHRRRKKNYKKVNTVEAEYQEFIKIWSHYIKSFKLDSTIEASLMILYLMEKGYFSTTKEQQYDDFNSSPSGMYYYHVFKGKGVCENYAGVANDLLNASGYDSAYMICSSSENNYNLVNHAACLIKEKDSYYLFDPTWKKFSAINGDFSASTIDLDSINFDLDPYFSYGYAKTDKERKILEAFIEKPNISHYIDKDILDKKIHKVAKLCDEHKEEFDGIYRGAKPHINNVIEEYDKKCKRLKDQKRLYLVNLVFKRKYIKGDPLKKL